MKNHGKMVDPQEKFMGQLQGFNYTHNNGFPAHESMQQNYHISTQETLHHELDNAEESLRDLLRNKGTVSGCMKEDTCTQMSQYKNAIAQCRNHIQEMENENQNLKRHIALLTTNPTQVRMEDVLLQCTTLSDRIKKMEEHNTKLVTDAERQKFEYERCLDKVASQVVQALLTQRRLQTECHVLRTQVRRLALNKSQDESTVNMNGYIGYGEPIPAPFPGNDDITKFIGELTTSLHSAGFSKHTLTETLSNCPTLPLRDNKVISHSQPSMTSQPVYMQTIAGQDAVRREFYHPHAGPQNYVNYNPYQGPYPHPAPAYQNVEINRSPPPPLHAIPETLEPKHYENHNLYHGSIDTVQSNIAKTHQFHETDDSNHRNRTHVEQKERKPIVRSHSFDNHSYVQLNGGEFNVNRPHANDTCCNNHRRSLENVSFNEVHTTHNFTGTEPLQPQHNQSYEHTQQWKYMAPSNDANTNNNNSSFNQSYPSYERGRTRVVNRNRHMSPPQTRANKHRLTLSPPTHRRSRSHDATIQNNQTNDAQSRRSVSERKPSLERRKKDESVWMTRADSNEPKTRLSTASTSSLRSPNMQSNRKKLYLRSPSYTDLPPPPPPPPEEEVVVSKSVPSSPMSPRLKLSVWKNKNKEEEENDLNNERMKEETLEEKSSFFEEENVAETGEFEDVPKATKTENNVMMETDFGEDVVTSVCPSVTKPTDNQQLPPRVPSHNNRLKKGSRNKSALAKPRHTATNALQNNSPDPLEILEKENGVIEMKPDSSSNASSPDSVSNNKPPLENRRSSEGSAPPQPKSRLRKSKLAAPGGKGRLNRERSKSEKLPRPRREVPQETKPTSNDENESQPAQQLQKKVLKPPLQRSMSGGDVRNKQQAKSNLYETSLIHSQNVVSNTSPSAAPKVQSVSKTAIDKTPKSIPKKKLSSQKSLVGLMKAKFGKGSTSNSNQTKKNVDTKTPQPTMIEKSDISSPIDFRTLSLEPNSMPPSSHERKFTKQTMIEEQQGQIGKKLSQPLLNSAKKYSPDPDEVQSFMNRQNSKRGKPGSRYKAKNISSDFGTVELIPIGHRAQGNNSLEVMMRNIDRNKQANHSTNRYSFSDKLDSVSPSPGCGSNINIALAKQKSASLDKDKVIRRQNAFENVVLSKDAIIRNSRLASAKRRSRHEYENVVIVAQGKPPLPESGSKTKLDKLWKSVSSHSLSKESSSSHGSKSSLNKTTENKTKFSQQTSYEKAIISSIVQAELDQITDDKTSVKDNENQPACGKSNANFSTSGSSKSATSVDSWPSSSGDSSSRSPSSPCKEDPKLHVTTTKEHSSKIPSGSRSSLGSFGYGSGTSNSSASSNNSYTRTNSANDITHNKPTKTSYLSQPSQRIPPPEEKIATRKSLSPMKTVSQDNNLKDCRLTKSGGIPTSRMRMGVRSIGTDNNNSGSKLQKNVSKPHTGFGFSGVKSHSQGDVTPKKLAPLSYGVPKSNSGIAYSNPGYGQITHGNNIPKRYQAQRAGAF